ncbi:hypothetical protein [Phenylobacterium sp.]|uniref:hypothetical protein n=1 Tax=Phenylobacterium sp. TaxID=1871053 RepID=UPI002DECFE40|nr:hypothetical protein [Phenylobacterium sp.]
MTLIDRGPSRDTTFRTSLRAGVWSVTKNNVFYGDYLSHNQAIRSACYGARAVEATGGQARVLAGDEVIAHRDLVLAP